ncbi:MAG: B12-binding domain-containing radical SAM protein [Patescibacteria group bacterium]
MNILLVYPQVPDTFWNFKHILRFISKKAVYPPLGLLTVAAILPADWSKRLIDLNVATLSDVDIAWADLVLISAMIIQKPSAEMVIERCRAQEKTILAGGPLFTARPEDFPTVDHIFIGEAENTLPQFIRDRQLSRTARIYKSTDWPDIEDSPTPLWSLINLKDYVTVTLQYSRGCPFDCEFCDVIILNGRVPRTKSPEKFIGELEALYQVGWRGTVFVADDNLIGNKKRVKLMLRALSDWQKKQHYPFRLIAQASVNLADDEELLNLMSKANFFKVFLGIETPNDVSLEECGKLQNLRHDIADAVKIINRHGLQVMSGFIVGFDNDQADIFERQKRFIEMIGVPVAMVGLLTALPGTRLYERLKAENRLIEESSGGNTDAVINFRPMMDKAELIRGYKRLMNLLYDARSYYGRINTFIRDYRHKVKGGSLKLNNIGAFLKSLVLIGFHHSTAPYYWRLLIKTLCLRPKTLATAVELAIQGYHFKKIFLNM